MEKMVDLSEVRLDEATVDQAPLNERQRLLKNGETTYPPCAGASHNSCPEDTQCLNSSKASGVTKDVKMLRHEDTSLATAKQKSRDVLDCQGDDDSSRKSVESVSQKPNSSVAYTHDPPVPSQTKIHGDGSDELVDVRVCDICGDAGREALLALCSTCSDGAEHIYCMRNKVDKVPEGGWMCEECVEMQELKKSDQIIAGKAVSSSNPSCLGKFSESSLETSPGVNQVAETSTKHLSKSFSTSGKRCGPQIEMSLAPKKKASGNNICPPPSLCGDTKKLPRNSSMINVYMGRSAALKAPSFNDRPAKRAFEQAFPSGDRSPKLEKRFCEGYLSKSKSDVSELKQQSKDDVLPCIDATKESADGKLKNVWNKKLNKSLSFAGSAPQCVSNVQSSIIPKLKDLKCGIVSGSERHLTKKDDVHRTKVASETARVVPVLGEDPIQVCRDVKAQTSSSRRPDGKKHANFLAKSGGKNSSLGHSSDVIICPVKGLNSDCGHKASHPTRTAELHSTAKDKTHHLVSSGNVLQHELRPVKPMPMPTPALAVLPGSSAVPAAEFIWKGGFKMFKRGKLSVYYNGIQAHLSTCASSSKVHEVVSKFGPKLVLNEAPRLESWPAHFRSCCPTEQDIALYFFAEDLQSYGRSYKTLLDRMIEKDLVLEASFDGVQLIVLPSNLLPVASQKWNSLYFLWGVCKLRKIDDCRLHLPGADVATSNKHSFKSVICESPNKCVSTSEAEKSSPSGTFQAPEAADALLMLSSSLTKFSDQSHEHDASSVKFLDAQEENDMQTDTIQAVRSVVEKPLHCRALPTADMLKGTQCDNQDVNRISKTDIFAFDKSYGDNAVPLAINNGESRFYYDGIYRDPNFAMAYNHTSATQSSISIDSGPSGSSDGGARSSDEAHGEQLEVPPNSRALDLNLRLGSPEEEQINLDLVLGFPSRYQPQHRTNNGNDGDMNMSLALSL
ncbi:hypothetical protein vseg_006455 [Gypsophila vaccaria]